MYIVHTIYVIRCAEAISVEKFFETVVIGEMTLTRFCPFLAILGNFPVNLGDF
jgi:hypothetical protein